VEFRASPDRNGREHFEGLETLIAAGCMITRLSIVFSAGALGGLLNALFFWLFGLIGITALAGMATPVKWDPQHIYWGVTWGLVPTLVAWFVVFPFRGMGPVGLKVGVLMPFLAIVLIAVWGIGAAIWLRRAEIHDGFRELPG